MFAHPADLFAELRANRPIFVMPGPAPAVVSRYRDVIEVADVGSVFGVKPYAATNGVIFGGANFLLGMDDSPQYEFEVSALRVIIRRTDLDLIRSYVAANAKALTGKAGAAGQLEIVEGFGRALPLQLAGQYFGVPGPDPGTLGDLDPHHVHRAVPQPQSGPGRRHRRRPGGQGDGDVHRGARSPGSGPTARGERRPRTTSSAGCSRPRAIPPPA